MFFLISHINFQYDPLMFCAETLDYPKVFKELDYLFNNNNQVKNPLNYLKN